MEHEQEDCEEEELSVQNRPRANTRSQKCTPHTACLEYDVGVTMLLGERNLTICERGWQDSTTEANRHLCQEPTQFCQDSQASTAVWTDSNHLPPATPFL